MDGGELLDLQQVAARLRVSESTVRRWIKAGHFPRAIKLNRQTALWREKDCDAFLWLMTRGLFGGSDPVPDEDDEK